MEATLGTLVNRLQGFLSKSLLLTGFLPMVVFLSLDILLAAAFFPFTRGPMAKFFTLSVLQQSILWMVIFLFVFVSGMVLWSLIPWIRQVLEGRHLPKTLYSWLEKRQVNNYTTLDKKLEQLWPEVFNYRLAGGRGDQEGMVKRLVKASQEGVNTNAPKDPPSSDTLKQCHEDLENLENVQRGYKRIPYIQIQQLFDKLQEEMTTQPAEQMSELDKLHDRFVRVFEYAYRKTESEYRKVQTEIGLRFPQDTGRLGPTQLANLGEMQREYGVQR